MVVYKRIANNIILWFQNLYAIICLKSFELNCNKEIA